MLKDLIRQHMEAFDEYHKLTCELGRTLEKLLEPAIPDLLEFRTPFQERGLKVIWLGRKERKKDGENLGLHLEQIAARHGLILYVHSPWDAILSPSEAEAVEEIMHKALGGTPQLLFEISIYKRPDGTYIATSPKCPQCPTAPTISEAIFQLLKHLAP